MKSSPLCCLLFCTLAFAALQGSAEVFDVRKFGAKGDGTTLDTEAIQKSLDECGKAGGGTVLLSAGTYLSKPIFLRSKTTLTLEVGAKLLATDERDDFLPPEKRNGATTSASFIAFVNGKGLTNIAITGSGIIDGSGARWWGPALIAKWTNLVNPGYTLPRPRLVLLSNCRNVRITDVTLANSPCFNLVPMECEDVVISNVTVRCPANSPNTDGIDPSASKHVLITKCHIDVGDDNIAIKAGRPVAGREFACEDLLVTDCVFLHGHGMSIGSESAGGVRNLTVQRCKFEDTENGIRIKSPRGRGGPVEDCFYSDITMRNVDSAITITCYYPKIPDTDAAQPVGSGTPAFRNITISNLTATCPHSAGIIIGLPESPVTNVLLKNIRISSGTTGLTIRNAKGVRLKNTKVVPAEGRPVTVRDAEVQGL